MSDLQLVLVIVGSLFLLVQLVFAGIGVGYAKSGRGVTIGFGWAILAAICFIIAVFV